MTIEDKYSVYLQKIMSIPMFQNVGAAAFIPTLDNINKMAELLDNPQLKYPTIHVAGTNGKGSVSSMLASILKESGLKVGLYTSPHMTDYRERIRVDGELITKELVCDFISVLGCKIDQWRPSFFEVTTAMAFYAFEKERVDIAVIEVGLGGRTDSTNIINPLMSIITNISIDHKNILGSTIEEIAYQKGGIIKSGVTTVIGQRGAVSDNTFDEIAKSVGAELIYAQDFFQAEATDDGSSRVVVTQNGGNEKIYSLELTGSYQVKNLVTTLASIEVLKQKNYEIKQEAVDKGLMSVIKNSGLYGRWQTVAENPLTICDTGHNEDGLRHVSQQLKAYDKGLLYIVIGFMADKEVDDVLPLFPKNAIYFFATASVDRSMRGEDLKHKANKYGLCGDSFNTVTEAYKAAKAQAHNEDMIFIGGSTFVVADFFSNL